MAASTTANHPLAMNSTLIRTLARAVRPAILLTLLAGAAALPAQNPPPAPETVGTIGQVGVGDGDRAATLSSVEIRLPQNWKGIRPWTGLSVVDGGTWWAGAGFIYDIPVTRRWVVTLGSGPFYYKSRDHSLGLDLEFYSFLEATGRVGRDTRIGLRVGHLSNAGFGRINPGVEDVVAVFVMPLGRHHAT